MNSLEQSSILEYLDFYEPALGDPLPNFAIQPRKMEQKTLLDLGFTRTAGYPPPLPLDPGLGLQPATAYAYTMMKTHMFETGLPTYPPHLPELLAQIVALKGARNTRQSYNEAQTIHESETRFTFEVLRNLQGNLHSIDSVYATQLGYLLWIAEGSIRWKGT